MNTRFEGRSQRVVLLIFLAVALYASLLVGQALPAADYPGDTDRHAGVSRSTSVWCMALKGRNTTASLLSCLALLLVILIPALVLLVAVLKQGIDYSVIVREWATQENIQQCHGASLGGRNPVARDAHTARGCVDPPIASARRHWHAAGTDGAVGLPMSPTSIIGSLTRFVVNFVLLLFVLFFVLRDHDKLIAFLHRALPLSRSQEVTLFEEVRAVSKTALMGSLMTAVTQGVCGRLWPVARRSPRPVPGRGDGLYLVDSLCGHGIGLGAGGAVPAGNRRVGMGCVHGGVGRGRGGFYR